MSRRSLIDVFVSHKVAANVLILFFLLLGCTALLHLNTQFLPRFGINTVVVSVSWHGASPADVEQAITTPAEKELDGLDGVLRMNSVSSEGLSLIIVEFKQDVDMTLAIQDVRNKVALVPHFPKDSKKPRISLGYLYDPIAKVILSTSDNPRSLRHWVYEAQQQLLDAGIDRVTIDGLPDEEIEIGVHPEQLMHLQTKLPQIADQLSRQSQDVAAGSIGHDSASKQVRSQSQARSVSSVADLPIVTGDLGQVLHVLDIAGVTQQPERHAQQILYQGKPAVELTLFRAQKTDALAMAKTLHKWRNKVAKQWPPGITVHVYYEFWKIIKQRVDVLLKNGAWGLLLIYGLLFLFLTPRVALWVAAAVPLSLLGALFALWMIGGSINMITLFALIMSLGIIVDDTIVVAEEGLTLFQAGEEAGTAAVLGAKKMRLPILAASLTTVASFAPLLLLGGMMGKILMAIPLVVICVIFSSLIESFFILPFHIKKSFLAISKGPQKPYRQRLDNAFIKFRDQYYKQFLLSCIHHKLILFSLVAVSILLSVGLLTTGRLPFTFFPSPDGTLINADVTFSGGTSHEKMLAYMSQLEKAAWTANRELSHRDVIAKVVVQYVYKGTDPYEVRSKKRLGSVVVELSSPEERDVSNQQFIDAWQHYAPKEPWVEGVRMLPPRKGMPGSDIDFGLYGATASVLKNASEALKQKLSTYHGVFNVTDNMPFAQNEYHFVLKPEAHALGLTTDDVGKQLRAAFSGLLVQTHYQGQDKIDVRIRLSNQHLSYLSALERFPVHTPSGSMVPLNSIVHLKEHKGFGSLQHLNRRLTVNVQAEVDTTQGNTNKIIQSIIDSYMPTLTHKYGVHYTMRGRSMEENMMLKEMKIAVFAMLLLIYLVLVWVSSSYVWPLLVMVAIPLGLEGAVLGHWIMGRDLTLLSLFGFFGLTGIVINDSIILLFRYKELLAKGLKHSAAIVEASCQRLRPVMLTSLTTIAGLSPLLFEKSLQAQFLIPMAISICFGLAFSTVLILVVIPALISFLYASRASSSDVVIR